MTALWINLPNADLRSVGSESVSAWRGTFLGGQCLRAVLARAVATVEHDFDRSVLATETLDLSLCFR